MDVVEALIVLELGLICVAVWLYLARSYSNMQVVENKLEDIRGFLDGIAWRMDGRPGVRAGRTPPRLVR
jgi:hypothetical protein